MEYLLVFFAVLGGALILWCLMGLVVLPVFGSDMVTLHFVHGEGTSMEHRVRAFGWLRDGGTLVFVDCGLTEKGKSAAAILQNDHPWVMVCDQNGLWEYLCGQSSKVLDNP